MLLALMTGLCFLQAHVSLSISAVTRPKLTYLTGATYCLASMFYKGVPLGTWETRSQFDRQTTHKYPEMGLDSNNTVKFGVYCSQDINHNSTHSNIWKQKLVQDVLDHLYHASAYCRRHYYHCYLGAMQAGSRTLEPKYSSITPQSSSSAGLGLSNSMFELLFSSTLHL